MQPAITRAEFRKGNSNSQIIKGQKKRVKTSIPKVSKDPAKPLRNSKEYPSETRIPKLSIKTDVKANDKDLIDKCKSPTKSINDKERKLSSAAKGIIPGTTVHLYPNKVIQDPLLVKTQSAETELLPIHEFAKMNEDFRKFKDNRKKSAISSSKDSAVLKASAEYATTRNPMQEAQLYNTHQVKSDKQFSVNQSNCSSKVLQKSMQKVSLDNRKTTYVSSRALGKTQSYSQNDKNNISEVMRSSSNMNSHLNSKVGEDDEVNYMLSEEDQVIDKSTIVSQIQVNRIGKARRSRGMRVDKSSPKNYYRRTGINKAKSSVNAGSPAFREDVTISAMTIAPF